MTKSDRPWSSSRYMVVGRPMNSGPELLDLDQLDLSRDLPRLDALRQ